jgi:hypothetical protein
LSATRCDALRRAPTTLLLCELENHNKATGGSWAAAPARGAS